MPKTLQALFFKGEQVKIAQVSPDDKVATGSKLLLTIAQLSRPIVFYHLKGMLHTIFCPKITE